MYSCVKLNRKNLLNFIELNKNNNLFNALNEEFFSLYDKANIFRKLFLRRRVTLLKNNEEYIGYLWTTHSKNRNCIINALFVRENISFIESCLVLLKPFNSNYNLNYQVEKKDNNISVLKEVGFSVDEGTLMLSLSLNNKINYNISNDIKFEVFTKGKHEQIRCDIQNEVFKNDARIPLTLLDIQMDELQDYYVEKGAIFIKKDELYIGYGQIILDDGNATIVNLGILKEYRGNSYGKSLLLYLLRLIKLNGYEKAFLKVSHDNINALSLYKSLGFSIEREIYNLKLKKDTLKYGVCIKKESVFQK